MEQEKMESINMVSEIELTYKSKVMSSERPKVTNAQKAHEIFLHHWDKNKLEIQEQVYALFLNTGYKALAVYPMSVGGIEHAPIDPRLLFSAALKLKASAIILCHNHPSGNTEPSKADTETTEILKKGGEILKIKILDHLIITTDGYYSMADNGMM